MGGGTWTTKSFNSYTCSVRGMSADDFTTMDTRTFNTQDIYRATSIDAALNPMNIMRECVDSEEHPNTIPVILALDVTGSMGTSSVAVAQKLNEIMTNIYNSNNIKDVEFCIMAIGDCAYDSAPIQMSQFESDIRIAEQLDKVWFEGHGGGNDFESYTAAWYMGLNHCKLDCWNRGKKGIIITLGDEMPNPYLPIRMDKFTGDKNQANIETKDLLPAVREKFDVYHISVNDPNNSYNFNNRINNLDEAWVKLLGKDYYFIATLNDLGKIISDIIINRETTTFATPINEVSW